MRAVTPVTKVTLCHSSATEDRRYTGVWRLGQNHGKKMNELGVNSWKRDPWFSEQQGSGSKVQNVLLKGVITTSLFRRGVIPCDICAEITLPWYNIY